MEGFDYRFWSDEDNRALVTDHYPWFLGIFDAYDAPIKRADAARYFILHRHGGIYVDLDFRLLRPLDPILRANGLLLAWENGTTVGNTLMGSTPGHPLMAEGDLPAGRLHPRGCPECYGPCLSDAGGA